MSSKVQSVVFFSLILDLFAFTIPLPLFPRLIEWYTLREAADPNGVLFRTLQFVSGIRTFMAFEPKHDKRKWDVVLLGGLMGSIFSTLQFFVSPHIGSLSDKYGRKRVLLITMVGNILSALVWVQSTTFASFLLSRAIGGLSEGNVQLAIAILSDISTPATRAKALSLVGIAFAICFCIGPPIGAYFSTRPMPISVSWFGGVELNVYATPAIITVVLLLLETVFLALALPETRGTPKAGAAKVASNGTKQTADLSVQTRLSTLRKLKQIHLLFLGVFSGVEFTLTFLTYDLFDWSNSKNGRLLAFIGIISAALQGGYVRRAIPKIGEGAMARRGVTSCVLSLAILASLPLLDQKIGTKVVYLGAAFLGFTSATVVNSLTSFASLQCDDATGDSKPHHPELAKGLALGHFRSAGQLGRAIGPLLACAAYWTVGPTITYSISAVAMLALAASMGTITSKRKMA